jgi:hypothetical protein
MQVKQISGGENIEAESKHRANHGCACSDSRAVMNGRRTIVAVEAKIVGGVLRCVLCVVLGSHPDLNLTIRRFSEESKQPSRGIRSGAESEQCG